eukprot:9931725-Ditylum_brightwellii.AAC.1
MRLEISKGRVSCCDLASSAQVGRPFANRIIREVDGTGLVPKTKGTIVSTSTIHKWWLRRWNHNGNLKQTSKIPIDKFTVENRI